MQANSGRGAKLLHALKLLNPQLTNITIAGKGVPVEILAILDPLSKTAQKVAPVLDFLQETLGVPLKVSLCRVINSTIGQTCWSLNHAELAVDDILLSL